MPATAAAHGPPPPPRRSRHRCPARRRRWCGGHASAPPAARSWLIPSPTPARPLAWPPIDELPRGLAHASGGTTARALEQAVAGGLAGARNNADHLMVSPKVPGIPSLTRGATGAPWPTRQSAGSAHHMDGCGHAGRRSLPFSDRHRTFFSVPFDGGRSSSSSSQPAGSEDTWPSRSRVASLHDGVTCLVRMLFPRDCCVRFSLTFRCRQFTANPAPESEYCYC